MPKGIYDRTAQKRVQPIRKQQALLRLLPEDNASQPVQVCERLRARLTVTACAFRFERAKKEAKSKVQPWDRTCGACEGCPIGEANSKDQHGKVEL